MRRKTGGDSPGTHSASNFFHFVFAIEINQVNRETHEESVDRFAGNNPKTFARTEPISAEQSFGALRSTGGNFQLSGQHRPARGIRHLETIAHISEVLRGSRPAALNPYPS